VAATSSSRSARSRASSISSNTFVGACHERRASSEPSWFAYTWKFVGLTPASDACSTKSSWTACTTSRSSRSGVVDDDRAVGPLLVEALDAELAEERRMVVAP
jgi:hypothetical protein